MDHEYAEAFSAPNGNGLQKRSKWLEEYVRKDGGKVVGRVSAFRVHETSSILTVNSDKGYYFFEGGFYRK